MARGGVSWASFKCWGAKRLFSPSQFHQEWGRVAASASRVRISSGVDNAVFIAIRLQNVNVSGLLVIRDGSRGSNWEDMPVLVGRGASALGKMLVESTMAAATTASVPIVERAGLASSAAAWSRLGH